jgi:hypothetical protein
VLGGLPDARLAGTPEKVHRQDVFGLQDGVALELADPVAVLGLGGQEIPLGRLDGVFDGGSGFAARALSGPKPESFRTDILFDPRCPD